MRSTRALSVAIASASFLWAVSASADTNTSTNPNGNVFIQSTAAQVLKLGDGNRGRLDGDPRLRYPGFEQTTVVSSRDHVVLITMEATSPTQGLGPVQCSCTSYKLNAQGLPEMVAPLTRLTAYEGERACNHPKAAADGNGNIVWAFGSDSQTLDPNNNNRPNMYAGVISEKCEVLAAPTMMSVKRDANDGAPDVQFIGGNHFILGYYSDGTNNTGVDTFPGPGTGIDPNSTQGQDGQYSIALGVDLIQGGLLPSLQRTWIKPIVIMTDIGRPTISVVDQNRSLFCAPYGQNRPSTRVQCGLIDNATGATVWKDYATPYNQQMRMMFNQPTVAKLDDTHYVVSAIQTNGMGQNTNQKGANTAHLFMLERNGDSMSVQGEIVGASAHQTHTSVCTGAYGEAGAPAIAAFSAAPTGIGRAAMQMVTYDVASHSFKSDAQADLWPAAWYGDSGHLSNWYGRNPMRQGRDFMRCIGGVNNPGYHQQNGFMPDVKSFFVGAVHGRIPGDAKNSLFVSFVPGQMDKKPVPQNPVPAGEQINTGDDNKPQDNGGGDNGGCGCSTPGTSTHGAAAALAGLAALGIVVARRRRR
jgi:MYXO-CTERM domain-containing protein